MVELPLRHPQLFKAIGVKESNIIAIAYNLTVLKHDLLYFQLSLSNFVDYTVA